MKEVTMDGKTNPVCNNRKCSSWCVIRSDEETRKGRCNTCNQPLTPTPVEVPVRKPRQAYFRFNISQTVH